MSFCFHTFLLSSLRQKNLKKSVGTCTKGNGDRVNRNNFNNAICRVKNKWQKEGDKTPWVWPESFIEFIVHFTLHLQGKNNTFFLCVSLFSSSRAKVAERPKINSSQMDEWCRCLPVTRYHHSSCSMGVDIVRLVWNRERFLVACMHTYAYTI